MGFFLSFSHHSLPGVASGDISLVYFVHYSLPSVRNACLAVSSVYCITPKKQCLLTLYVHILLSSSKVYIELEDDSRIRDTSALLCECICLII